MISLPSNLAEELEDARSRARVAQEETERLRVAIEARLALVETRLNAIEDKNKRKRGEHD